MKPAGELLRELQIIFAEHTGYDVDELEPEYQLEADLGIDTVKQAEIFSVIRESYGLGQDDSFSLSDYQTLQAIVGYVKAGHQPRREQTEMRRFECLELWLRPRGCSNCTGRSFCSRNRV